MIIVILTIIIIRACSARRLTRWRGRLGVHPKRVVFLSLFSYRCFLIVETRLFSYPANVLIILLIQLSLHACRCKLPGLCNIIYIYIYICCSSLLERVVRARTVSLRSRFSKGGCSGNRV